MTESPAPPEPPRTSDESKANAQSQNQVAWLRRAVRSVAVLVATSLLALVVADCYERVTGDDPPPAIDLQLRETQDRLEREGFRLIFFREAQLQATGPSSHIFLLRPRRAEAREKLNGDEIQIYDEDTSGRLSLTWRFAAQPIEHSGPKTPLASTVPTRMVIDSKSFSVRDFDATPGDELVFGLYEVADRRPRFPRPFLVRWEAAGRRYSLDPLLSTRTVRRGALREAITTRYLDRDLYARALVSRVYRRTTILRNRYGNKIAPTYAVEAFYAVPRTVASPLDLAEGHIELATGYIVGSRGVGTAEKLQVVRWDVRITPDGGPRTASPVPGEVMNVGPNSSRLEELFRRAVFGA